MTNHFRPFECSADVGVSASRSATLSYVFCAHMGWGGVGLCSRSFNLHTLVMYTPGMLLLRYSWGGVGWGCVHVPSTCTRWWCTRQECYCYGIHGLGWGRVVFTFLQLAHAGDVHARNVTATVFMGWGGAGLCSRSFNLHTLVMYTPGMLLLRYPWVGVGWGCVHVPSTCTRWWCTRQECYCYGIHGVGWGGVVFTFLQLAHAGDVHARNVTATVFMGWGGVGLCTRSFNLHTLVMYTPGMLLLRYSWGGVGRGCVHVPSTCTRWWCTRQECYCYGIHGLGWGGVVFTFLQLGRTRCRCSWQSIKERKKKKKGVEWATHANTLQITVNLKKKRHLRRAFQSFCASWQFNYKCYMLENLGFFHISSKNPVDADIANRKHYSPPAGAVTMFLPVKLWGFWASLATVGVPCWRACR